MKYEWSENQVFMVAFERTVGLEGGYSNDPLDPGGETKFGISKRANPDIDVANLTIPQARQIYYERYWKPMRLNKVKNELVQMEMFDTGVNCGVETAVTIAQRSLVFLGEDIETDGQLGPVTAAALNRWISRDLLALFKCLNGFQFMHYVAIVEGDKRQKRWSRGWMKRIQEYKEVAT